MADNSGSNGNDTVVLDLKESNSTTEVNEETKPFFYKLIAEGFATYFFIFAGCGAEVINWGYEEVITFPGIAIVWGLAITVLVYSVSHISGAHFNPAVTIAFATVRRFPWKQVPAYVLVQVLGATLAAGTLRLLFTGEHDHFTGTLPTGSHMQSFVIEFIITFYLMFVKFSVTTDYKAIAEMAGLAMGAIVLLNVMFAGTVSGASMNPARSLGPAIVSHNYKNIWIYLVAPTLGAIAGAWVYNTIGFIDKPLREITKRSSFLRGRDGSN